MMVAQITQALVAIAAALVLSWAVPAASAAPATQPASPEQTWADFSAFCAQTFGAEMEPLAYERFGKHLKFLDDGAWQHISTASAAIAFETNLPARTVVEFGIDDKYGQKTAEPERFYYLHLHYLTGLKPDTTYHYRLVAIDERGNRIASGDVTFRTAAADAMVAIPGDMEGPPYVLDKPGKYVLTQDLACDGGGISIMSGGITLDLGGHTITYNNKPMSPIAGDDPNVWFEQAPKGVYIGKRNLKDVRIVNGAIRQGAAGDRAQGNGQGPNPIGSFSGVTGEIAGVTVEYHGDMVHGLNLQWGPPIDVHHNVITDKGIQIANRHQGVAAIHSAPKPHHNLIKRSRHRGIDGMKGGEVYRNEVYIDSCATNSSAIGWYKGQDAIARENRVFGTGYLVIALAAVSKGTKNVVFRDNYVHLQATAPSNRWTEYGDQSGAYCFRVTWGGENIQCFNNYLITRGRDGGMVRGVWYCPDPDQKNNVIRDNVIKAMVDNDKSDVQGAIVISGADVTDNVEPGLFVNNRVISNFCHVKLGEPYGVGRHSRFVGNTFIRDGDLARYRLINIGYGDMKCFDNLFVDSRFEGKTGFDSVKYEVQGRREFSTGVTVTIRTAPGAAVEIADATGAVAASGTADEKGTVALPAATEVHQADGKTPLGPLSVTAQKDGQKATKQVSPTKPQAIDLPLR